MSQGIHESFNVLTTLAAYRIVSIDTSAANTVVYPPSTLRPMIGVTADTVRDTTSAIPVIIAGKAKLLFNDTVSAGGLVSSDTSGRGIGIGTLVTTGTNYIGVALNTVSNSTTIHDILVQPGSVNIEVP
jgi:hypothetical protein